ncbi:MAG: SH3 domain-containing protein [Leptospiraceae bacterium]|nr:SH3 domain-containing protein [Leptospiraceae bacterium]
MQNRLPIIFRLLIIVFLFTECRKSAPGVATAILKVRALPTMGSEHLATLEKGLSFSIVAEGPVETIEKQTQPWLQIESATAKGWVFGGFVERSSAVTNLPKLLFRFGKAKQTNVHEKPDAQSKRIGIVPYGTIFTAAELVAVSGNDSWLFWKAGDGYISAAAVSDTPLQFGGQKLIFNARDIGEHDAAQGGSDERFTFYNGSCEVYRKTEGRGFQAHEIREQQLSGFYTISKGKIVCQLKGNLKETLCYGPEEDKKCDVTRKKLETQKELIFVAELGGYVRAEDQTYLKRGSINRKNCSVSGPDGMNGTIEIRYWCI